MVLFLRRPSRLFLTLALLAGLASPSGADAAGQRSVKLFGVSYVEAKPFGRRFGLSPQAGPKPGSLLLKSKWTTLGFAEEGVEATLNGVTLFLSQPVVSSHGKWYVARCDADRLFAPILVPKSGPAIRPVRTIVIDPGHGGHDPGNQNRRLKLSEKTFTLDVAQRLKRLLDGTGVRVVLTRTNDRYVSLDDRADLAERLRADLFVSIHFNAFAKASVAGVETYVMTPRHDLSTPQRERDRHMASRAYPANRYDHWNAVLGYQIHRSLVRATRAEDRGLKRFRYSVLRSVSCPAVLVEAGFLSNTAEARKITSAAYRQRIAAAIASGIKEHRRSRLHTEAPHHKRGS